MGHKVIVDILLENGADLHLATVSICHGCLLFLWLMFGKLNTVINLRRACARVTVVVLCVSVCLSLHLSICLSVPALAALAYVCTCNQWYSRVSQAFLGF